MREEDKTRQRDREEQGEMGSKMSKESTKDRDTQAERALEVDDYCLLT